MLLRITTQTILRRGKTFRSFVLGFFFPQHQKVSCINSCLIFPVGTCSSLAWSISSDWAPREPRLSLSGAEMQDEEDLFGLFSWSVEVFQPLWGQGVLPHRILNLLRPGPCLTVFPPVIPPAAADSCHTLLRVLPIPILAWTFGAVNSSTASRPWFPLWLLALHQTYSVKLQKKREVNLADDVDDEGLWWKETSSKLGLFQ